MLFSSEWEHIVWVLGFGTVEDRDPETTSMSPQRPPSATITKRTAAISRLLPGSLISGVEDADKVWIASPKKTVVVVEDGTRTVVVAGGEPTSHSVGS